jgi:hypothetical protein
MSESGNPERPHDWIEEQLKILRPMYPKWELWAVRNVVGPPTWCARPEGADVSTIRVHSPKELVAALQAQESGQS